MRVNFAEVRNIPVAAVLAHYHVEVRKRSNTELVARCPFPSHKETKHKNDNPTLAISTEKNRWYCHSDQCRALSNKPKGGDCIDVVAMMENLTPIDAAKKLAEMFAVGDWSHTPPSKPSHPAACAPENKPLAFVLNNIDPDHPFIRERGISLETAMEYGVGFFPGKGTFANRIVFPLYEEEVMDWGTVETRGDSIWPQTKLVLVGYAGRTILEVTADNPKWLLPKGLHRSFLFGLNKCRAEKPIMLVESPWACLYFHQHRLQAAALVGTSLTESQERLLDPFKEIVIAMDNDDAGRAAAEKLVARLKPKHKVSRAYLKE